MNNLSIIILHYTCPPIVGGVEEVVRHQASILSRYGHRVKIIVGEGEKFDPSVPVVSNSLLSSRNYEIIKMQNELYKNRKEDIEHFNYIKNMIKQFLLAHLKKYDILIAHNVLTMRYNLPLTYVLHEISNDEIIKVVAWCHDSLYFYKGIPEQYHREPYNILKKYNEKIHYVTISKSRQLEFNKLFNKNIKIIENGIDPSSFFKLTDTTREIIEKLNLYETDFIMVQPSRLHPRKNIELSIKITKALIDQGLKTKLLVTGAFDPHEKSTKQYHKKLENLINELSVGENVFVLASFRDEFNKLLLSSTSIIRDLYLIADALIMSSIQEGFGIPLIEAGMIKLPIICSNIEPFRHIAEGYALFFDLNEEPSHIAKKIIDYMESLPTRRFFRHVINNYTWDNIYKYKLYPYLKSIVGG